MSEANKGDSYKDKAKRAYSYYKNHGIFGTISNGFGWLLQKPERLTAISTFIIAVSTAVAAAIGIAQWRVLNRTDKTTRDALVEVQRAFMFISGVHYGKIVSPFAGGHLENFLNGNVETSAATAWRIDVIWENGGSTPTKNLVIETNCVKVAVSQADPINMKKGDPYFDQRTNMRSTYIFGPKQSTYAGACLVDPTTMMTTEWGGSRYFIYGKAIYNDVIEPSISHVTEFCIYLTNVTGNIHADEIGAQSLNLQPIAGESAFCPYHNCTDDECNDQK